MTKVNGIPTKSRDVLAVRDARKCVVCGGGRTVQWHHRRSRRVVDVHRHCACNGVLLCATDHSFAHTNPEWAINRGLIVSQFITEPGTIPVLMFHGWVNLTCDGQAHPAAPPEGR